MKTRFSVALLTVAFGIAATVVAQDEGLLAPRVVAEEASELPATHREYRLAYQSVGSVSEELTKFLASAVDTTPETIRRLQLITADVQTNRLTVIAPPKVQADIANRLKELDAMPQSIEIHCVITQTHADGRKRVLSRPLVRTLDGQTSQIVFDEGGEVLEITLTPRLGIAAPEVSTAASQPRPVP